MSRKPGSRSFFSNLMKGDDGVLRDLLIQEGLSEIEAAGSVDRFVFEVNFRLENSGECALKNFGFLRSGANGTVVFDYLPAVDGDDLDNAVVENSATLELPQQTDQEEVSEQPASAIEPQKPVANTIHDYYHEEYHEEEAPVVELAKSRYDNKEEVLKATSIRRDKSIKGLIYKGDSPRAQRGTGYKPRGSRGVAGWLMVLVIAATMLAIGVLLYGEIFGDKTEEQAPVTNNSTSISQPEPGVPNPDDEYIQPSTPDA